MTAEIGIIGGSGFYSLIEGARSESAASEYGSASDALSIGRMSGRDVAFLPRHGTMHTIPPHKVPYRANIDSMSKLGVERILATNAVGSLKEDYRPGELVLFDQFFNATNGRSDTFYDKDIVAHMSIAEPYCPELRSVAAEALDKLGYPYHKAGTVVVINGPRFSTKSESRFFARQGFETINMTQYPEVVLAREKGICYLGIGLVTDYDVGLEGTSIRPVTAEQVMKTFAENVEKAKRLVSELVPMIPKNRGCNCSRSMDGAIQTRK
ncbi:MAG: S-methyl-5'-thioadenosine phosphorylase [Candidatus Micrarchaeota archaeon]|nr:S-methyl-5'-thioadenosine phosphorylase [Candidatus Micrarchaeota archaeon]MDE1849622.1 S-methyl-5'-thioadenosine phosphorylase [Candidatus Micrarchaeota archaeon]